MSTAQSAFNWIRCTRTATPKSRGAGRRCPMARCWWGSPAGRPCSATWISFWPPDIKVVNFTFSAAAVHSAVRLNGAGLQNGFIALGPSAGGGVEVYGESQARPVFTAEFQLPPERAASLGLAELRLAPETAPLKLEDVLPKPAVNPVENDLARNPRPYATALAGACPWVAPAANLLAPDQRQASSRAVFIPTAALATLLLLVAGAILLLSVLRRPEVSGIDRGGNRQGGAAGQSRPTTSIARSQETRQRSAAARPVSQSDAPRHGRAERIDPADRAAGVGQQHHALARLRDDFRRSAAGRSAAQDSRFVAVVRELRVPIAGTRAERNGNFSDSRDAKVPGPMTQVSRLRAMSAPDVAQTLSLPAPTLLWALVRQECLPHIQPRRIFQ